MKYIYTLLLHVISLQSAVSMTCFNVFFQPQPALYFSHNSQNGHKLYMTSSHGLSVWVAIVTVIAKTYCKRPREFPVKEVRLCSEINMTCGNITLWFIVCSYCLNLVSLPLQQWSPTCLIAEHLCKLCWKWAFVLSFYLGCKTGYLPFFSY